MTDGPPGVTAICPTNLPLIHRSLCTPKRSPFVILQTCAMRTVLRMFDCKRQNMHACEASPDHRVVPQHFKLALQINHHHCLGNRLRLARKPDNFPIRNYCRALQYPGTFFLSLFFCRRITSKRPEVEPCRIGLAQDKAILCCSHLKLKSIARRKNRELRACCRTSVFYRDASSTQKSAYNSNLIW